MKLGLTARLRTMMFLQFFLNGTTLPIFSLYLRNFLHFSGTQAGLVIAMSAASSFVSPVLASLVADRLLRVERLYGLCHAVGGLLMFVLSFQHRFLAVLFVYLAYFLVYGPTNALVNVIALHHSPDARREYSGIRVWGTIGWVSVAWLFGFFWLRGGGAAHVSERLPDALILSSIVSFVIAAYSLLLPRSPVVLPVNRRGARVGGSGPRTTPPLRRDRPPLFPKEALKVLLEPQVLLFLAVTLFVGAMDTYYYFGASLYLASLKVPSASIMPLMSIGQIVEVASLSFLGLILGRFSFKAVLIGGVLMEMIRFLLLFIGAPFALVVVGLGVHGLCFTLFFGTAPLFLDSRSTAETRAGVQQFFSIVRAGLGALIGNLAAGWVFDSVSAAGGGPAAFRRYWVIPTLAALAVAILMVLFFREKRGAQVPAGRR